MINVFKEKRQTLQAKLLHEATDYEYRFKRYHLNYSIAIGFTPESIDMTPLSAFIRASDRFVVLEPNICAIILDGTADEGGIKAANNLLTYFQNHFFGHSLFASVATASNFIDASHLVHEVFDLLEYAIANNMDNLLIDSSQVINCC